MTDKELRKLSRLEILELLLNESSENKKLHEELDKLKSENSIEKTTERLKETAEQFDESLQNVENLFAVMQQLVSGKNTEPSASTVHTVSENTESSDTPKKKKISEDADIYRRIMQFFFHNMNFLSYLPHDLNEDITKRLSEILTKVRSNETDKD